MTAQKNPTRWGIGIATMLALAALSLSCDALNDPVDKSTDPFTAVPGGDAERGKLAILHYGCGTCHTIPGIPEARGDVGPPLDGLAGQRLIAGQLPNRLDQLVYWIRTPQQVDPQTAMVNMGVSEQDARDIAAYLYSQ